MHDLLTIILGFFEGFVLIISPCIFPILPIVLAGSLAGSKKRPMGIITGFVITFAIYGYFSRKFVQYTGIDMNVIRHISYGILLALGLIMISTYLTEQFNRFAQRFASLGSNMARLNNPQGGFKSGLFLGAVISIIWTPCAGPILAAIIVQIVTQTTTLTSFLALIAFALGAAIPMYIIALYGIIVMDTFSVFKKRAVLLRKFLGVLIIASVAYMIYQEGGPVPSPYAKTTIKTTTVLENGLWLPYRAPEIEGIDAWINSPPLTLQELQGKVVLIDFWTYSCINCVRTLGYLKEWYRKYHDKGLVIIGIHTPEFDFEKELNNVKNAVIRDGIRYPVALDNQFVTWSNFHNLFWPAHYLINKKGVVVYQHSGEGAYDVTENNIRYLLGINELTKANKPASLSFFSQQTPETYLGYSRSNRNQHPPFKYNQIGQYTFPAELSDNSWALNGAWKIEADKIVSAGLNSAIKIHFNARKVFIVMGNSTAKPLKVKVLLNGEQIVIGKGKDVENSHVLVDKYAIFEIVNLHHFSSGILQIIASDPGLAIYTFTFGS